MASEIEKAPVLEPGHTYGTVTDKISNLVLTRPYNWRWVAGMAVGFALLSVLLTSVTYLFLKGIGIWGLNVPVMWAFDITNFVWWVGIGHAGTLISAILLLLKQEWRTSINRFAEAMTLFAVSCAGLMPLIHLGRPWVFYWLMPYFNTMGMWPQWRSALVWDVFAVSTYATVSLLFWYIGLIPDVATLRDRAKSTLGRVVYGFMAMGWRGSARHWHRYKTAYLLMASLATPLVVSVHTVVSFDFAEGIIPGWHSTIFPPYFVAGAIFSGFAMVLTLAIPLRAAFGLEDFITMHHLENMAKVLLATGMIVTYGYAMEVFFGWYSANQYEQFLHLKERPFGDYWHTYWLLIFCNCLTPQILWWRRARTNVAVLFIVSLIVNWGMWLERYIIIVTSLHTDFLPSSWNEFHGTVWDYSTFLGSIGLFTTLLFLFIRFLPVIAISEMRELVHETQHESGTHAAGAIVGPQGVATGEHHA